MEYIDPSDHIDQIELHSHTVIFGRRGAGKTMLLTELERRVNERGDGLIWVDIDKYKKLDYPDVLIQILRVIFAGAKVLINKRTPFWRCFWSPKRYSLMRRLKREEEYLALRLQGFTKSELKRGQKSNLDSEMGLDLYAGKNQLRAGERTTNSVEETHSGDYLKSEEIDRHLHDASLLLRDILTWFGRPCFIIIDDFYHLGIENQASVLDYVGSLVKNEAAYLKIGTIPHRSKIYRIEGRASIGSQLRHDIQPIDLDKSFRNFQSVQDFISRIWKEISKSATGSQDVGYFDALFGGESWHQLILASGGVPRDFINVLARAIERGRDADKEKIDTLLINEAATLYLQETKNQDLTTMEGDELDELEKLKEQIVSFCVEDAKKNVFLITKDDSSQNRTFKELMSKLLDYRYIHQVHENTSAKSYHGRYEAYMLDLGLYAHPPRRGDNRVQEIAFWERGADRKQVDDVRLAPIFKPDR